MSSLADVLSEAASLPWDHALYLPTEGEWSLQSCALVSPLDDDDSSTSTADLGLKYVLTMSSVQDIVANARLQKDVCSLDDLFAAFLYYWHHDAFIVL
jgi:hypothetical protein